VTADLSTATEDQEESLKSLREGRVPAIKAMPGFVAGYWCEPDSNGISESVVIFESEEEARQATESMGAKVGAVRPFGTFKAVEIREVIAHA
jgi:hypothetical protein